MVAPLEINPQIIYWDPATYPDVETLADLGEENITINVFGGGVFSDVFVGEGIWNADQVDPSYDGSPARFIAEDGKIAQQGFASAEPYTYEHVFEEWGKPVAYQTPPRRRVPGVLADAGRAPEADSRSSARASSCFVPIVQQAAVDFVNDRTGRTPSSSTPSSSTTTSGSTTKVSPTTPCRPSASSDWSATGRTTRSATWTRPGSRR